MRKLLGILIIVACILGTLAAATPARADTCTLTALAPADAAFGLTLVSNNCIVSAIGYDVNYTAPVPAAQPFATGLTLTGRASPFVFDVVR